MASFETLHEKKCNLPVYSDNVGEWKLLGSQLIQKDNNIWMTHQILLTIKSQLKIYANQRQRDLEFEVGDHIFFEGVTN